MDTEPASSHYDQLPYPGLFHALTHPASICTVATLLGLATPDPRAARILVIGCGDGTNVVQMAETLPGASLYGFDYTTNHVAHANRVIAELGIRNLRVEQRDIMEFGPSDGQFDYIIAHGIYSWVPEAVRQRALAICRENLSPNGIAYMSYNAYPGWHLVDGMRRMMFLYTVGVTDARERVAKARELLGFLDRNVPINNGPHSVAVHSYAAQSLEREDAAFGSDDLSEVCQPFYLTEFVAAAEAQGLAYLHEARFSDATGMHLGREAFADIAAMTGTPLQAEQLADFVSNRSFRRALLCQPERLGSRNFDVDAARLGGFFASGEFHPRPGDAAGGVVAWNGAPLAPRSALGVAALAILGERFPATVAFEELVGAARARVPGGEPQSDADTIAATLALAYSMPGELLTLWPYDPGYLGEPPERPRVGSFARYRAAHGERSVGDRLLRTVDLDPVLLALLPKLDGEHTRTELYAKLVSLFPDAEAATLASDLDQALDTIARNALLIP